MTAKASFYITDISPLSPVDSTGNQRMRGHFDAYFTSGRIARGLELQGLVLVESPPGTPRTLGAIQATIFAAVRTEVNRLDASDSRTPATTDGTLPLLTPAIQATRYDATNATPTAIASADIPPVDPTPPRI